MKSKAERKSYGISRRTFLMGALASATAPSLLTSRIASAAGPNDMMLLGAIGVGRMGRGDMLELIHRGIDNNARVVAVCDLDSKRLEQAKKLVDDTYAEYLKRTENPISKPPECKMYGDFRELLERQDIDGVLIATPDFWHANVAIAAAKAGKDFYVEKPVTYSIAEGRALADAVRKYKRVGQVGSQQRSNIYFRKACELVRNGRVGQVHTIRVTLPEDHGHGDPETSAVPENLNFEMWLGPSPKAEYAEHRVHPQKNFGRPGWLQIEDYCLGMITGWGAHMNDIAQWGNGTDDSGIVEIEASAQFPKRGLFNVHTTYQAEGKFSNGVKLFQASGPHGVRFEGDEGWIFVSREELTASDPKLLTEKLGPDAIRLYESKTHMGNFLECMRSRKDPVAPIETGHRSNTVCMVTHIAMKLGRKLQWDPASEKFINDDEANSMIDYKHREPWSIA